MSGSICKSCKNLRAFLPRLGLCFLGLTAVLLPRTGGAIDTATLALGGLEGDGWAASNLRVFLAIPGGPGGTRGARLTADSLTVRGVSEPLRAVKVDCPTFELERQRVTCARATVEATLPMGKQRFSASLEYELATGALAVKARGLQIGGGEVGGSVSFRNGTWIAQLQLQAVDAMTLLEMARAWSLPLPVMDAAGKVTLDLRAQGTGAKPVAADFTAELTAFTTGTATGTLASDKLDLHLAGHLELRAADWAFSVELRSAGGQAYAEPVFLDFGAHPIEGSASGRWRQDGHVEFDRFAIDQESALQAHGLGLFNPGGMPLVEQLDVTIEKLEFPGAYSSYLQPFLLDTTFKQLETAGRVTGHAVIAAGAPQRVELDIDGVSADDGTGRFALYGLGGHVAWRGSAAGEAPPDSRLAWEGGLLLGLDIGATTLDFRTSARDFEVLHAVRIPVLDGALELGRFRIRAAGLPEMNFALDADILPISVQRLSRAFGWPEFGGRLAGKITDLKLEEGVLTLATTLQAQVFDGRIEISDLRLEQPFGDWPRLYSSIALYNLDLEQATSAFSFGLITGRLSGYVNELVLFNWMPVEFDLRLYTPPDDRSRHRINQRAVANIGNLGGGGAGVGAALSSGFMSFFDEFNYARLGISCRLENDVCLMDGVDPAPHGGYYLVKGRGIPRIDVIGNADRVDWPRLVAQLKAIAASEGPVVE